MGKKLNQQHSLKIAKKQQPTHQFKSLIDVLKPEVHITNSSNFKALVQKLTGNGSQSSIISPFPPPTTMTVVSLEPPHVIQIDDHDSPDNSLDSSFDPNLYYSFDPSLEYSGTPSLDYSVDPSLDLSIDCSLDPSVNCSPESSLDNTFMPFDYSYYSYEELGSQLPQSHVIDYVNEIELRNIESFLLDFDPSICIHDAPFMPMNA